MNRKSLSVLAREKLYFFPQRLKYFAYGRSNPFPPASILNICIESVNDVITDSLMILNSSKHVSLISVFTKQILFYTIRLHWFLYFNFSCSTASDRQLNENNKNIFCCHFSVARPICSMSTYLFAILGDFVVCDGKRMSLCINCSFLSLALNIF